MLTIADEYVLRMDLILNDNGQKIEITSDALHDKYIGIARKARVPKNWSMPMYSSEINLSTRGLMWWNPERARYEVANVKALEMHRSQDVNSFGLGLWKVRF